MKNKSTFYSLWSAAIIICLALSALAIIIGSVRKNVPDSESEDLPSLSDADISSDSGAEADVQNSSDEGSDSSTDTESDDDTNSPYAQNAVRLAETPDAGESYLSGFRFLGDSTTYGLKAYKMLEGGEDTLQVWTPSSGTLTLSNQSIATIVYPETEEEISIVEAVTRSQPKYLLITLGVNGISFMDEEYFIEEYTNLVTSVQSASPNTKIILNSIYPVATSYPYQDSINNEKIRQANIWVEGIAEQTGTKFLDTQSCLVDGSGNLPDELQNGDGIHLNESGFALVLNYIRTHAWY